MKTNPNDLVSPIICGNSNLASNLAHWGSGLTKRELFAKDLTAALMSNPYLTKLYIESGGAISELATDAGIIAADALIKKLNEGKDENI